MGILLRFGVLLSTTMLLAGVASAQGVQVLCDFEDAAELKLWEVNSGTPRLVSEGAIQGKQPLEITFDPDAPYHGAYLNSFRLPQDWSGYDALVVDVSIALDGVLARSGQARGKPTRLSASRNRT